MACYQVGIFVGAFHSSNEMGLAFLGGKRFSQFYFCTAKGTTSDPFKFFKWHGKKKGSVSALSKEQRRILLRFSNGVAMGRKRVIFLVLVIQLFPIHNKRIPNGC